MSNYILDSSALLAVMNEEPGSDKVEPLLDEAAVSAVNLAEIIAKLVLTGLSPDEAEEAALDLVPNVVPFDREMAALSGKLAALGKPLGLSLGDGACLATAIALKAEAVTADKVWSKMKLPVKIRIVR